MSSLKVELVVNHRDMERQIIMRDTGLGMVVIDQLPHTSWWQVTPHDSCADIKYQMAAMYYYCAPRDPRKAVTMTFSQAINTSRYLKETN